MSALLRGARVFSNETENNASVRQEMTTNINVKLKGDHNRGASNNGGPNQTPNTAPNPNSYPSTGGIMYPNIGGIPGDFNPGANFTQPPLSPRGQCGVGNGMTTMDPSQFAFPVGNGHPTQIPVISDRAIDLEAEENKDAKIKVLEALLEAYEGSPIVIKGFLTLHHKKLIEIIQILTEADKVELMTDDGEGCSCGGSKYAAINKIFIVESNGKRGEFKVSYNEEYSLLIRHGVNLKLCRV
jgi:hypothetical protein